MKNILSMNSNIFDVREDKSIKIPKALESCCDVLNVKYIKGEKCPILGRDTEISSMWNIFSKKTKRNVMIVDLDTALYVVDNKTVEHRIVSINIREKIVYCEDGLEFEYSTSPLTVVTKDNGI